MRLGIDASNIRAGGGVTHLAELLKNSTPRKNGFKKVYLWGSKKTLSLIGDQEWLVKINESALDRILPIRILWQQFVLPKKLKKYSCDILFSPGGTIPLRGRVPMVTMSQNMLPFEPHEMRRFNFFPMGLKLNILRIIQKRSFSCADGVIFLTRYAKRSITKQLSSKPSNTRTVPHGIDDSFFKSPRKSYPIKQYDLTKPFRLLYVSIIDVYKHQWEVAKAVAALRVKGYPVEVTFIGPSSPEALVKYEKELAGIESGNEGIHYLGGIPFSELASHYHDANAFIFASSCENMPNIMLEAMASGLPIACSDRGPMPEVLGDAGVYFDPERWENLTDVMVDFLNDAALRRGCANKAYHRAKMFSWRLCAEDTFSFLARIATRTN